MYILMEIGNNGNINHQTAIKVCKSVKPSLWLDQLYLMLIENYACEEASSE